MLPYSERLITCRQCCERHSASVTIDNRLQSLKNFYFLVNHELENYDVQAINVGLAQAARILSP